MTITFQSEKVAPLLKNLLVLEVGVKDVPPSGLTNFTPAVVASYENADGILKAACLCDLELVLNAGAALCLIPSYEAVAHLRNRELDPALMDNFKEVLNVCSQLFLEAGRPLRLATVTPANAETQSAPLKAQLVCKRNLQVSIAGYASGRLSVLI